MTKKTKKANGNNKQLKITRRIVSTKRHTTGYVVGGQTRTVPQVKKMAERNQISGVRVVGQHVQSVSGRKNLLDLPVIMEK